jgi:alanine racemase
MARPTFMHIDLDALVYNYGRAKQFASNSKIIAMVKADAYGHGLVRVVNALQMADAFGVACLEEAIVIRKSGLNNRIVLVGGFFSKEELPIISKLNIDVVIHQSRQIDILENIDLSNRINVWCKIDVGMHRLGFSVDEFDFFYKRLIKNKNVITPINVMAHFSDADDSQKPTTIQQLKLFEKTTKSLSCEKSLAASAAIIAFPQSHYDWVRPGIMLYGVSPIVGKQGKQHDLKPVMSLKSKLMSIRVQREGDAIGYGGTWRCPEKMPTGVVAIGYGDGYPRHARSGTNVMINNTLCPIIGRVSMDLLAIDLRQCPNAKVDDDVILWGDELPVEIIAENSGTIGYELLTGVTKRVHVA